VFIKGVEGMRGHIANAHKVKMGSQKITHVWVVENCGEELSEESIDLLRADTIASLLRWRRLLVRMKRTC
jgi:hypothetical protein